MIGRDLMQNVENFSEYNAKNFAGKFLTVTEKSSKKKNEMISLGYDANDHVYSKLKSN